MYIPLYNSPPIPHPCSSASLLQTSSSHLILLYSVEFCPPRSEEEARKILKCAQSLKKYRLDFVSITYGAGGSTRKRTLEYGELLNEIFGFEVMPHLTCVEHSKDDIREILKQIQKRGFRNIMALRGDPPENQTHFKAHPNGFRYACELVEFIKKEFPHLCLGVAGYPEGHPEAPSVQKDLENLKYKVDKGASFITTQLFFDNAHYYNFLEACKNIGINVPIIPGILIVNSLKQAYKMSRLCQSKIPKKLEEKLILAGDSLELQAQAGTDWAYQQICDLLKSGIPGFHLYILNRSQAAISLLQRLDKEARILTAV